MTAGEVIEAALKKLQESPNKGEHLANFQATSDVGKFVSEMNTLREIWGFEIEGGLTISNIIALRQVAAMRDIESALLGFDGVLGDLIQAINNHG